MNRRQPAAVPAPRLRSGHRPPSPARSPVSRAGGAQAPAVQPPSLVDLSQDPILQQIQAANLANVQGAQANELAGRKQALIDYGSEPGLEGLFPDQSTQEAAKGNPFSVLANLLYAHQQDTRGIDENLNQQNLFYSSEHDRQNQDEQHHYQQGRSAAYGGLRSQLGPRRGAPRGAEQRGVVERSRELSDAYARYTPPTTVAAPPAPPAARHRTRRSGRRGAGADVRTSDDAARRSPCRIRCRRSIRPSRRSCRRSTRRRRRCRRSTRIARCCKPWRTAVGRRRRSNRDPGTPARAARARCPAAPALPAKMYDPFAPVTEQQMEQRANVYGPVQSEQQIQRTAGREARAQVSPLLKQITGNITAQSGAAQANLAGATRNYQDQAAKYAPAVADAYQSRGARQGTVDQALAAALQQNGGQLRAGDGERRASPAVPPSCHGCCRTRRRARQYGAQLPVIAANAGNQRAGQVAGQYADQLRTETADLNSKIPGLVAGLLSDLHATNDAHRSNRATALNSERDRATNAAVFRKEYGLKEYNAQTDRARVSATAAAQPAGRHGPQAGGRRRRGALGEQVPRQATSRRRTSVQTSAPSSRHGSRSG
jgi:hypothetical protein